MPFVIDASATLPWCFEDESTLWTESLLNRLSAGEQGFAPAHWPIEVSNALLMALRRKRIPLGHAELVLDQLASLPIVVEPPLSFKQAKAVLRSALAHPHLLRRDLP